MFGHGGPTHSPHQRSRAGPAVRLGIRWFVLLCAICFAWRPFVVRANEVELRLHITWGGGAAYAWQGGMRLTSGTFDTPSSLSREADDPGSLHHRGSELFIAQRSPSTFSGIDVVIRAPLNAELVIDLEPREQATHARRVTLSVADLITKPYSTELDNQKNRIVVTRAPGDQLRVEFDRDHLVFSPSERFELRVAPNRLDVAAETTLRCKLQLTKPRSDESLWSEEKEVRVASDGNIPVVGPFSIPLPTHDGVYEVAITVTPKRLTDSISLVKSKPLASRRVQLVVIDDQSPPPDSAPWKSIGESDPIQHVAVAESSDGKWNDWLKRMPNLKVLPGFSKGPIGNKKSVRKEIHGRTLVQLDRDGWQAFPLPVAQPNLPHILEVEYPAGLRQSLGISVVEPNAAGRVTSLGLDSGVDVPEASNETGMLKHRLVFWPRGKTPLVLLTNLRDDGPAWFGKLTVLAGPTRLPSGTSSGIVTTANLGGTERLLTAFFDKPLFPENFGVVEALDSAGSGTLDDWLMFYEGGKRLVEYLRYAGYNSAVISAACEGSALYPSQRLQPTPKYDSGVFFATGQDPVRKDVLEMLFRMFDRDGLRLIPAVHFATPLPELEMLQRAGGDEAVGMEWIGVDGRGWLESNETRRGLAPYYNPLHPSVGAAMCGVVAEIEQRYSQHISFAGLALQLGPDTFAQLPDEQWGFDDATITRFERSTKMRVPGSGVQRFTSRAAYLLEQAPTPWLNWRAETLADLYRELAREVTRTHAHAKLFLATADSLSSLPIQNGLRPVLSGQANAADALLRIGLDPKLFANEPAIALLRPQRIGAMTALTPQAASIEFNRSAEVDRLFLASGNTGTQAYLEGQAFRPSGFDEVSPFGATNTSLSLIAHCTPSGIHNRRRFVHSVATLDSQSIFDGGWMLPLGQEESLRPIFEVYRQLPAEVFSDAPAKDRAATQPLVVRQWTRGNRNVVYVVNDSRWPANVEIEFTGGSGGNGVIAVQPLGRKLSTATQKTGSVTRWSSRLEPYDLQAIQVSGTNARVSDWRAIPDTTASNDLNQRIQDLRARANSLRSPRPLTVLRNPGFELTEKNQPLPGWVHDRAASLNISVDTIERHGGKQSLRLRSDGPVVWIRSDQIPLPITGRLALFVQLKTTDAEQQPPLHLAIDGTLNGKSYYRPFPVGAGQNERRRLTNDWKSYFFEITDLPTTGLTDLRIGFDLMGAGDVWIDDVQLFDLYFFPHQQDELLKRIAAADFQLEQGAVADCERFLDGYWPRYLFRFAPIEPRWAAGQPPKSAPQKPTGPSLTPPANEPSSPTWKDRMNSLLPKKLRG